MDERTVRLVGFIGGFRLVDLSFCVIAGSRKWLPLRLAEPVERRPIGWRGQPTSVSVHLREYVRDSEAWLQESRQLSNVSRSGGTSSRRDQRRAIQS